MKTSKLAVGLFALALSASVLASPYTFELKARFTTPPGYPYVDAGSEFFGRLHNSRLLWPFGDEKYIGKNDQGGSVDLWMVMGPGPLEGSTRGDSINYYAAHTFLNESGNLDVRGQTYSEGSYGSFSFSGTLSPFTRYIDRYNSTATEVLMAYLKPTQGTVSIYTDQLMWIYADITEVKVMMPVPEPSTYVMLLVGIASIAFTASRTRR